MNTLSRVPRLAGCIERFGSALVALAFCASAFGADADKNVVVKTKAPTTMARPIAKKQIYVITSASAIPQPIERVAGPIVTTAIPIQIITNRPGN